MVRPRKQKQDKQPDQPKPKTQIIYRPHPPIEVCNACGAIMPFVQHHGMRQTIGGMLVASARCKHCGALASIRRRAAV
jgi:hypothetical protein